MSTETVGNVMVVDGEVNWHEPLRGVLDGNGYKTTCHAQARTALQALRSQNVDVLLASFSLPDMEGVGLVKEALEIDPCLVCILLTEPTMVSMAAEAVQKGAFDYVLKPPSVDDLLPKVARAMDVRRMLLQNRRLREALSVQSLIRALAVTHDVEAILEKALEKAFEYSQADEGSVMFPTEDGEYLIVRLARGEGREKLKGERAHLQQSISGWVARHGEPLILNGRIDDPRFQPVRPRDDIVSAISLPMMLQGKVVGVLNVNAVRRSHPFTFDEVQGLSTLATATSLTLVRSELYQDVRRSQAQLEAILGSAPVTIMLVDAQLRVRRLNLRAVELSHRSAERTLGKPFGEVLGCLNSLRDKRGCGFSPDCPKCLLRNTVLDTLTSGNSHLDVEARLCIVRQGEKEEKDFLVSTAPVEMGEGEGRWVVVSLHDITERNRAWREAQRRNLENAALLEAARAILYHHHFRSAAPVILESCKRVLGASAGFVAVLSDDEQENRVVCCDSGTERRCFDPPLPMKIRGVVELSYRQSRVVWENALQESEWVKYLPQGHIPLENVLIAPLVIGQRTVGQMGLANKEGGFTEADAELASAFAELAAIAFLNSNAIESLHRRETELEETNLRLQKALTELRNTQEQVIQQERLRALGQMASGIAHDFNNALAPVLGFTDLLLMRPETLDNRENVIRYLQMIRTSAEDASNVVRRLREFYRKREEGELFLPVDINQVVRDSVDLTRPRWKDQAMAQGADIEVQTELGQVPKISGNESELREALTNMIFNAVDAMPEGGTITLRTMVRKVGEGESAVVLEISDTGMGMDEATRQRCLDPFFSTKGERGTGMGLAMVFGTVVRHEGSIEIESEVGVGTTFRLSFPLREMVQASFLSTPKASASAVKPLKILVVEDDDHVRNLFTMLLEQDGHAVTEATDGRDGFEKFKSGSFDLVITDRAMPRMNGDQLAAAVKEISPGTPVIMLTGFGDIMDVTGETVPGVDRFLSKPVSVQALREVLHAFTDPSPPHTPEQPDRTV